MKKFKKQYIGIAVAMAGLMLLVFAGCKDPTDFSQTDSITNYKGLHSLPAPDWVNATGHPRTGVIRVSWAPVPNATGYMLYRTAEDHNGVRVQSMGNYANSYSGGPNTLFFDDVADFQNTFVDGGAYTYRVVAFSNWSSNPMTATIWSDSDNYIALQNSSRDSNTVRFGGDLTPATGQLPAPEDVRLVQGFFHNNTAGATLGATPVVHVSWRTEPGVDYIIAYGIGNDNEWEIGPGFGVIDNGNAAVGAGFVAGKQIRHFYTTGANEARGAYTVPLIHGTTYVEVIATVKDTSGNRRRPSILSPQSPWYYTDSQGSGAQIKYAEMNLPTPSIYARHAMEHGLYNTYNPNLVYLNWYTPNGNQNDGVHYRIYRLLASDAHFNAGPTPTIFIDGWKDVTYQLNSSWRNTDERYIGRDRIQDIEGYDKDYVIYYMVIAEKDGRMSLPYVYRAYRPQAKEFKLINLGWDQTLVNGAGNWRGIHIEWNVGDYTYDGNYKLTRVNGNRVFTDAEVTNKKQDGFYGVIDNNPPIREAITYILEMPWGEEVPRTINTVPYVEDFTYGVTVASGTSVNPTGDVRHPAYIIRHMATIDMMNTVTDDGASVPPTSGLSAQAWIRDRQLSLLWAAKAGDSIRISRIQTNALGITYGGGLTGGLSHTEVAVISALADFNKEAFTNPGPGTWSYMAELRSGSQTTALEVAGGATSAAGNSYIVAGPTTFTASMATVQEPATTTRRLEVAGTGHADRLQGTRLTWRVFSTATAGSDGVTELANMVTAGGPVSQFGRLSLDRDGNTNIYRTGIMTLNNGQLNRLEIYYEEAGFDANVGTGLGTLLLTTPYDLRTP